MPRRKPLDFKIVGECFVVTSHSRNIWGYPKLMINYECKASHRFIWEQCFGKIPEGMSVCHCCDNPACINPEHLFLGTHSENMKDKSSKGRQSKGPTNGMTKLTPEIVKSIRERYKSRDPANGTRAMAREYGVNQGAVSSIIRRKTWAWM